MFGSFFDITKLQGELNPEIFTWDSIQGVVVLLVLIGIGVCFAKKITRFFFYGFMYVIFMEIMHVFALSEIGSQFPVLQTIFRYNVLQSLAQLCVGTPVSDILLYIQVFINNTFGMAFTMVFEIWKLIQPGLKYVLESLTQWSR